MRRRLATHWEGHAQGRRKNHSAGVPYRRLQHSYHLLRLFIPVILVIICQHARPTPPNMRAPMRMGRQALVAPSSQPAPTQRPHDPIAPKCCVVLRARFELATSERGAQRAIGPVYLAATAHRVPLRADAYITPNQLAEGKASYSVELSAQTQEPAPCVCSRSSTYIQYIHLSLWIEYKH